MMTSNPFTSTCCVLLATANCLYGYGIFFGISGPPAVQDLIQGQRCTDNFNTSNASCCDTCLGFTPVEYNMSPAIALWTSLPLLLILGLLLDRVGAPYCALVTSIGCIVAGVIRLVSSLLGDFHSLCFGLMVVGDVIFYWMFNMSLVTRNYIAGHYFPVRLRPISTSLAFTASTLGSMTAFFTVSSFGHRFGLPATFGLFTGASTLSLVAACVIWIGDKTLSRQKSRQDVSQKEEEKRDEEEEADEDYEQRQKMMATTETHTHTLQAKPKVSTTSRLRRRFHQVGGLFLLLILLAAFASDADLAPFVGNSILFLVESFGVEAAVASRYTSVLFVVMLVVCPLIGLVVGRLGHHEVAIAAGGCLSAFGLVLLTFVRSVHPLVGIVVFGCGEALTNPNIPALTSAVVSPQHLGAALSIIFLNMNLSLGIFLTLTGVFVEHLPTRAMGWTASMSSYIALCGLTITSGVSLVWLLRCRGSRPVLEEVEKQISVSQKKQVS